MVDGVLCEVEVLCGLILSGMVDVEVICCSLCD